MNLYSSWSRHRVSSSHKAHSAQLFMASVRPTHPVFFINEAASIHPACSLLSTWYDSWGLCCTESMRTCVQCPIFPLPGFKWWTHTSAASLIQIPCCSSFVPAASSTTRILCAASVSVWTSCHASSCWSWWPEETWKPSWDRTGQELYVCATTYYFHMHLRFVCICDLHLIGLCCFQGQNSSLTMHELLQMARDIANGCCYLEENQFIHRFRLTSRCWNWLFILSSNC